MKKTILNIVLILAMAITFSSCATVFGGPVDDCQLKKPAEGENARQIRVGALIADLVLFWPATIIDFTTGAIYRPCSAYENSSK